jgi:hypothetical protein
MGVSVQHNTHTHLCVFLDLLRLWSLFIFRVVVPLFFTSGFFGFGCAFEILPLHLINHWRYSEDNQTTNSGVDARCFKLLILSICRCLLVDEIASKHITKRPAILKPAEEWPLFLALWKARQH